MILLVLVALLFFMRSVQPTGNVIIFNNGRASDGNSNLKIVRSFDGEPVTQGQIEDYKKMILPDLARPEASPYFDVEISKKEASEEREGVLRKVSLVTYNAKASRVMPETKRPLQIV